MAERIGWLRRTNRRQALRPLGVNPDVVRGFVSEVTLTGQEAAILALPFWNGALLGEEEEGLQFADGTPAYMFGVSGWGLEPWGP